MDWIAAYLKKPHGVTALLLLGVAFGFIAFRGLPLNLFPDANYPQVAVVIVWPGAAAGDMTDKVSRKVEKEFATIDRTRRVRASVRDETAAVTVEFEYEKGLDAAVTDVSAALDRIRPSLPPAMLPPRIFRVSDASQAVLTLAVSPAPGSDLSMSKVRQLAENEVQERFLRIDGVADVDVFGGYIPEIEVRVDRDRLAAYGLSTEQVISAIAARHRNIPSGTLLRDHDRLLIKIAGETPYRHELGRIIIGGSPEGGEIHLDDIAGIHTGHEERQAFYRGNGKSAIGLNILRPEGGHVTGTLNAVEKALPEIRAAFPGLSFEIADTQGDLIRTSVSNLTSALRDAVLLTVIVIFFFLAWVRMTLLAAVSIPFTFLLTFAGMKLLDYEMNIVTMTAVILAVGLLVDDAIVVVENIDRHASTGKKTRLQAAIDGTREIFLADFAGTVTTLAVLVPIMFVGGYSEKILRPLTVVLSIALLASFVSSVTIIPLFSRFLIKKAGKQNKVEYFTERLRDRLVDPLQNVMIAAYRTGTSRWFVLIGPLLIVVLMVSLKQMPLAGRDLMPPMDTGIIKIAFETWPNMSLARTEAVVERMERIVTQRPGYVRMSTVVGAEPAVISFGSERTPQEGIMTVHFRNRFERSETIWEIEDALRNSFSGIPGIKTVHVYDYGATPLSSIAAPIDVMLSGPDPRVLDRLAGAVLSRLHEVKGLTSVSRSWDLNKREIAISPDEEKLARQGISFQQVADTLTAATTGRAAAHFRIPGEDGYGIRLRFDPEQVRHIGDMETLLVPGRNGMVPLKEIARLYPAWEQTRITRENLQPTVNVQGYRAKAPISYLMGQVDGVLSDLALPTGYSLTHMGEINQMGDSFSRLGRSLGLALLFLYFALVITFRSYLHPVIIMSAIPLAFIGVPWGMILIGRHFCMPAAMGMILLSGIVVNNSILLIDFIETARAQGMELNAAVEEAIHRRTRPILMTAFSTVAGMTPIAAELAVGLERLSPLAVVAISGLIVSTFLTLAYVPVIYVWMERLKKNVLPVFGNRSIPTET